MLAFKLYDFWKWEIYHPNILLNPKCWDKDDVAIYDNRAHQLLQWKLENLYNNWEPKIISKEITITNQSFILKEIDISDVDIPEDIQEILDYIDTNIKDILYSIVKKKLYDDMSYQIVSEILINKSESKIIEDHDWYEWLFELNFEKFFTESLKLIRTKKVTYEELDNIVIKKTSKLYYNEKLPTPYLPLLSREHIETPDWQYWHPRLWQLYFLYHEVDKKINLVLSSRQSGKTLSSTLVSFMHLMRKDRADILYVVESEDKIEQPFQYFSRGLKKYVKAWIFSINKWDKTIKCNVTSNTLKFMSAGARSWLKSFSAPIVIFDEASFLKWDAFMSTMPLWSKPNWKFYAFTTVDWNAKEHWSEWFYELFKSVELWISDTVNVNDALALKVTVDQNEAISDEEKKIFALLKKTDMARYLADYYCIISWDDNLFDKQKLISPVKAEDYKDWYNVLQCIYWFDPAKSYDYGGLTVSYVIQNKDWGTMLVAVEEHLFKKVDYYDQISHIKNMLLKQKMRNIPTSIIMDWTWVWNAVYEMLAKEITDTRIFRIIYTAGKEAIEKHWAFYVPKKDLVDTLVALSSEWKVKIPYNLKELVTQLDTYRKVQNRYEAIGNLHDDQIESFMNTVYLYYTKIEKHLNLLWDWVWKNKWWIKILSNPSLKQRYSKFIY